MRLILCENYDEVSKAAAKIMASQLILKPASVLGLATGSTPLGMYKILAEMNQRGDIDFSEVKSYNLDEYYPIDASNDQSYRYFMNENLFSKVNINIENTHVPCGTAPDPEKECEDYEKMIESSGGIDLQVLGIGQNGHIGFNEPGASLNSRTHLTDLTENTINANSRFFASEDDVPRQALTMGIGTILKAKKIILLASGANKHRVVTELLNGGINTDVPASMLKLHPDVVLICDRDAYSSERIGIDLGGTEVKFGVLNDKNELVYKDSIETDCSSESALISSIAAKCNEIKDKFHITGVGVGTPGIIRDNRVTAVNLPFKNTNLEKLLSKELRLPVSVSNDANCAALGEALCGSGKEVKNLVTVTLGTGIGGGIISDNKIYQGKGSAGEIGHICIVAGGRDCSCGHKGCWEQYASVSALVRSAKTACAENPDSLLAKKYSEYGKMSGRIFFEALNGGCEVAKGVFDEYLGYLAAGINSLIYIFDPDMLVLSGGITNAGDALLKPICERVGADIPIKISSLKSDAGVVGAAMLV